MFKEFKKKYKIIYADPPWFYNSGRNKHHKFKGGCRGHYPVMEFEDIYKMPISDISDKDCALFLWVTFPNLIQGIETINRWGFEYKTIAFNWMKTNKLTEGRLWLTVKDLFFGVGYYTKSNSEICLLGVKGKMKPISNSVSSAVLEPINRHSEKPAIIRDRIVDLYGDLPRIELFSRKNVNGWDSWGNEINRPGFGVKKGVKLLII